MGKEGVCILFDSIIHVRFLIQELAGKNISGIMFLYLKFYFKI